jgi:hypothetical protein
MFKHELGKEVKTKVRQLAGIITARSENLYGCNRYFIEPPMANGAIPDGMWVDEDDVNIVGDGVFAAPKKVGGPMSPVK